MNLLSLKLSALFLELHHENTTLAPAPGFPSFPVIPVLLAKSLNSHLLQPSPLPSASLQPDGQMWSSALGPLRFPFHSDWRATSATDSYLVISFFNNLTCIHVINWKVLTAAGKSRQQSPACPVNATEEPGLNFSTGMPPDHTGHKSQSRKPSGYTQTINYLSTPRTDPAQLSK